MGYDEAKWITDAKIRTFSAISGDIGGTVQILKDGVVKSAKVYDANLKLDFTIPGRSKYVVKDVTTGLEQTVIMSAGAYVEIETGLSTSTWAGIKRIIDAGRATEFLEVGDVMPNITDVNENVFQIVVAGINTYGLNEVDFISKTLTANTYPNTYSYTTITPNWFANGTILYNNLPENIRSIISNKQLRYISSTNGSSAWGLELVTQKVWVPTFYELGLNTAYNPGVEASIGQKTYPLFTGNTSRIMETGIAYWLSTSYFYNSLNQFGYIGANGVNAMATGTVNAMKAMWGFRIAPVA